MSDPKLSCPKAKYVDEMRIWCTARNAPCGHIYYKQCKGWWALTPSAESCPIRKESGKDEQIPKTAASSRD